jgi:hypothetical protein
MLPFVLSYRRKHDFIILFISSTFFLYDKADKISVLLIIIMNETLCPPGRVAEEDIVSSKIPTEDSGAFLISIIMRKSLTFPYFRA